MSALPPKADIAERHRHVRFVPKADIERVLRAGHRCFRCPIALNNGPEHFPNSGSQSHRQRPPERHPSREADVNAACTGRAVVISEIPSSSRA